MSRDERQLMIPGPVGQLEISVNHHPDCKRCAIICHPHPQGGGTMSNKVVTTLAKGYQLSDFTTVRFNYRGVGKSEGDYADGLGETEDLVAVTNWVKEHFKHLNLHYAGFSFGTFVVLNALQKLPNPQSIQSVILIAPPVERMDYHVAYMPKPCLLVQCDDDEIVSAETTYDWIESLYEADRPDVIRFQGAGHFFHGRLVELRKAQIQWLSEHVTT